MNSHLTVNIVNELSELERLTEVLEDYFRNNNISGKINNTISLALDEIITNIISYGYSDDQRHMIKLDFLVDPDFLTVIVEDDAQPFNPLEQPEPDISAPLEEKQVGGLGIYLIRSLLDILNYERINNKNVFTMKKKLN